jgi:hypothetical protein
MRFLDEFVSIKWSGRSVCLKTGELGGLVSTESAYLGALGVWVYMVS